MYTLNSIGLRQLLQGRPVKMERMLDEPKGEEYTSFLKLKRADKILQSFEGTCNEIR